MNSSDEPEPTWSVAWTATARRNVERLPERAALAAIELIYGPLAVNPHRSGHRLHFELEGLSSARRGPYRVIYGIDVATRTVTIHAIAHRSTAYRSGR